MKYEKVISGSFISRPNRFKAVVMTEDGEVTAHVKNTGRCRELFVPGAKVWLQDHRGDMGSRKTAFSLIGVEKSTAMENSVRNTIMVNVDSQAPNKLAAEALLSGKLSLPGFGSIRCLKAEAVYGDSRLDFYAKDAAGTEAYVEVKGVTLERDGAALFPDAPTERGIKHLKELVRAVSGGKKAYVLFVVQMKGPGYFSPNDDGHRAFGDALREAAAAGVCVMAADCVVYEDGAEIDGTLPVVL